MSTKNTHSSNILFAGNKSKDKHSILDSIVKRVEKGAGLSYVELKSNYSEERLFLVGLKYVTTTKKALCEALSIPIEAGCRYKRKLEKNGLLVQSVDEVVCPFTHHLAHLISTNPKEFAKLQESSTNQLNLFD